MPADHQQPRQARQLAGHILRQRLALRREQESLGWSGVIPLDLLHRIEKRGAHHDHARPTSERAVVHTAMPIRGEIPDVHADDVD
jgi:hypothetical protein